MNEVVAVIVAVVVVANILAALWLIWWSSRGAAQVDAKQTTHVWDEDLTEYNNPLPRWWLWLFVWSIVFGFIYLALYPGLGNFRGLKHWSEVAQYQQEDAAARRQLEQRFAAYDGKSLLELSRNPAAMLTARNLFALNCSPCHGSDARGAKGFPNLTDQDWLWGGSEETVYQTIAQGRDGVMPAWGPVLGRDGVEQVLAYVLTLSGRQSKEVNSAPERVSAGKAEFTMLCAACHGADGKGNAAVGAPNLTDNIWLHGSSVKDIRESITQGRNDHMPAHLERLGATKSRLLAAYVLSLSQPIAPAPSAALAPQATDARPQTGPQPAAPAPRPIEPSHAGR
jgi:cytochrome c oxidase cbb3-type subunit 3